MPRMTIVGVTGASGFIGSAVVRQLVAAGRTVRAFVEPGANLVNLKSLEVERVEVDICDAAGMASGLAGCDTLYHLAAIYRTWMPNPELIYRVNVGGTTSTLLAAQKVGVKRIVYTSSIAAIGLRDDGQPSDETVPFNLFDVANDYILSKWEADDVAQRFARAGAPIVIVNPGFPFGPGDIAPTPTGKIMLSLLRKQVPGVSAGGFAAIDVDDLATGHLLAEQKGRVGESYLLTNHNVTMADFFRLVGRVAGVRVPPIYLPSVATAGIGAAMEWWADHVSHTEPPATYKAVRYMQKQLFFDNTKARNELGLPTRPLEDTIARAVKFFRDSGMV